MFTKEEAQVLEKFASIGYQHVVDVYSDQIVQEKVAQALIEEEAKGAPQKIASEILRRRREAEGQNARPAPAKTASDKTSSSVEKLAKIKREDPELFSALQVMAKRKLL